MIGKTPVGGHQLRRKWVTANPDLNKKRNAEQAYRRVARLGDGWMTTFKSPEDVQTSLAMIREYAREMGHELKPDFEVAIYHNINVDQDRDRAFAEAKRFLDSYYSVDYRQDMLKLWVAAGSPAQCVQSLQRYVDAKVAGRSPHITLRPHGGFER